MKSPINDLSDVDLLENISVEKIIRDYKKSYKIDVQKYFADLKNIDVYQCSQTGYRFYYPFTISGDSDFYIHFQEYDWYYMPWKWEHEICLRLIEPDTSILEVGCGKGEFLKKIHTLKNARCIGLELNESSSGSSNGVAIVNTSVETFSENHKQAFDMVCSFQVLEHVAGVHKFIQSQIHCLKRGGKFIVSVPNNESLILKSRKATLNMPPHHMGLWDEQSLRSLELFFPLKMKKIYFEPIQPYHYDWYISRRVGQYVGDFLSRIAMKIYAAFGLKRIAHKFLARRSHTIKGHSILAVYEKI